MATDSQWSGLLIVVIFVAIFAVTSVSAMAIYFFCKCKRKNKERQQIRPAPRRTRGTFDDDDDDDEEEGVLFHKRADGMHWVTDTKRPDTPHVAGVSGNYMAERRKSSTDRENLRAPQRITVDQGGTYDSSNYRTLKGMPTEEASGLKRPIIVKADINSQASGSNQFYDFNYRDGDNFSRVSRESNRSSELHDRVNGRINSNKNSELHDRVNGRINSNRSSELHDRVNGRINSNRSSELHDRVNGRINNNRRPRVTRRDDTRSNITGIGSNLQILKIDENLPEIEENGNSTGIYTKPQRVRVRESSSRGSCVNSLSPQLERTPIETKQFQNRKRKRTIEESQNTSTTPRGSQSFMFTASSKMAWMFDS